MDPYPDNKIKFKKIVRITLIPTILWLFLTFIFEKWCKCTLNSNNQKKCFKQIFCWHLEGQWRKWQDPDPGSGSISQRHVRIHTEMSWIRNTSAMFRQMDLAGQWRRRGFSRNISGGCFHCPLYQVESWIWLKRKCSFSHFCDNSWFGHQFLHVL